MPGESSPKGFLSNNFLLPKWGWLMLIFCFACCLLLGQAFIGRQHFGLFLTFNFLLYSLFIFLFISKEKISLKHIVLGGMFLRIASAFIMPLLSEDVYRFIWDGQLLVHGFNPLNTTPNSFLAMATNTPTGLPLAYWQQLHGLINHTEFYTCYPPLMQGCFGISAWVSGSNVSLNIVLIKLLIALADCGTIYMLLLLLRALKKPPKNVLFYAFFPAIIIEGSGNAHFEVMQAGLVCAALYAAYKNKLVLAAIMFGFAIITKLTPLMLLPLWVRYWGVKKGFLFSLIACSILLFSFLPFTGFNTHSGFFTSINLYFQNFEFNASIYYLARALGWWYKGYNWISVIGPALMASFLFIYAFLFFVKTKMDFQKLLSNAVLVFSLFYLFSTTVHPWYIINLLPFALLAGSSYPFIWAALAVLSYSAYSIPFLEKPFWLIVEYGLLFAAILLPCANKLANRLTGFNNCKQ